MNFHKNRGNIKYKGVSKGSGKNYRARIKIDGKELRLGTFSDPIDAARAYDRAAKEFFGEFARLNGV